MAKESLYAELVVGADASDVTFSLAELYFERAGTLTAVLRSRGCVDESQRKRG